MEGKKNHIALIKIRLTRICRRARRSGRRSRRGGNAETLAGLPDCRGKARSLKKNLTFRLQRTNRGSDKLAFPRNFLVSAAAPSAFCVAELLRFLSETQSFSIIFNGLPTATCSLAATGEEAQTGGEKFSGARAEN